VQLCSKWTAVGVVGWRRKDTTGTNGDVSSAVHQRSYRERDAVLDRQPVQLLKYWHDTKSSTKSKNEHPHFVAVGVYS